LWVIYWKRTKHQLWLIWVPALRTNQQLVLTLLDNLGAQLLQLVLLPAAITLRNRYFA
jgi:hypothetical protein